MRSFKKNFILASFLILTACSSKGCMPIPKLVFSHIYLHPIGEHKAVWFYMTISNWADYPDELFEAAPNLPPCGANTNSSRTWVNIKNSSDNSFVYGYCGFNSPSWLRQIHLPTIMGESPPPWVYVTVWDRLNNKNYRSNSISLPQPPYLGDVPNLSLRSTELIERDGKQYLKYLLTIINWDQFPSELFE